MSKRLSRLQEKAQLGQEVNRLVERISEVCSVQSVTPQQHWDSFERVSAVTAELLRVQKKSTPVPPPCSEEEIEKRYGELSAWMTQNGADVSNVKLGKVDIGERGLIATKDINADDLAMTIPAKVMMSVHSALTTPLSRLIRNDPLCKEMPNMVLALHILNEKFKRDSFWKPYIQLLPKTYYTPLYYGQAEMEQLRGTTVLGDAVNCRRNITMQYSYLYRVIRNYPDLALNVNTFTFDEFRWAVSTIMTRQNSVPLLGEGGTRQRSLALVPFWDMVNHRQDGHITTDFDDEGDSLKCFSMWKCDAGKQFMMYYGDRSSLEFLINSAFVPDDNQHDKFRLKLGISSADKLIEKRLKVFESCALPPHPSGIFTLGRKSLPLPVETTLFLRVFCMTEDELDHCNSEKFKSNPVRLRQILMDCASPFSLSLYKRLWSFLNTRCELLMRQYPGTNEADDLLLEDATISPMMRAILMFRKSERRILREQIEFAKHKLELLESSE